MSTNSVRRYIPLCTTIQTKDWLYLIGEVGLLNATLIEGGIAAEFQAILRDIRSRIACTHHGLGLESITHFTVYLLNRKDAGLIQEAYAKAFGDSRRVPRIVIAKSLSMPGAHVEVDVVAYIHKAPDRYEDYDPR